MNQINQQMDDARLMRAIVGDPLIRQACEYLVVMISRQRAREQCNGRYSLIVQGRQVKASCEVHYGSATLPPDGDV